MTKRIINFDHLDRRQPTEVEVNSPADVDTLARLGILLEETMPDKFPMLINCADLKVGDVVELFDGPWSTAIVKNIKDDMIEFWRPYGTHAGFTASSGLICYTGLEVFKDPVRKGQVKVWQRDQGDSLFSKEVVS